MINWAARSAHIDEQVLRLLARTIPGRTREAEEWTLRRHAANRWEELRRVV